jgi:predicted permease
MQNWWRDLRYAVRMLGKNVTLTLVIVASLAIGIGANAAIFSVVDALLLRPLPYPDADRLAAVWIHSPGIGIFRDWPSPGQYLDLQNQNHSFEEMALGQSRPFTLTGVERPERLAGMRGQSNLLKMLGAHALLGRVFAPAEDNPGQPASVILSYRFWQRQFNSDPNIVGQSVKLDGNPTTVVGVLPRDFMLNAEVMPSEEPLDKMDIFLTLPLGAEAPQNRFDENYNILVRLKPGVSVVQAQADVDVIANRIREKDKRDRTFGMQVVQLQEMVVGDVRRALLVLLGAVTLVLLIACANVANLLLTRAAAREKEVAVRTALGASFSQLARQLLTESVLLSLLGGVAGLFAAKTSLDLVRAMNPGSIPRLEDVQINWTVLLFTFGVSLLTGILFGLAPVWRALRVDLNTSLKSGGRTGQSEGGLYLRRHRLRGLLVVSELALSLVLVAGAGLLVRSFMRLQNVPPGFNADKVLTMQVASTGPKYHDDKALANFHREVEDRISHLPGVAAQGFVSVLPLTGSVGWGTIHVEGYTPPPGQELQVDLRTASADYFRAMEIPLVKGRFYTEHDNSDAPRAVIIDQKFADRFWPESDPIGKHVWFDPKRPYTIVGVVGVVKQYGLEADTKIVTYRSDQQSPDSGMFLAVRSSTSSPQGLAAAIVDQIHAVDPDVVAYGVRPMEERLYESLARQRFSSTMLGAFAALALLLAAVGLFGVMSYLVSQSTRDIGVLVTLGAQPGNIMAVVLRQGMELAAIGIFAGLVGALALTRVMSSLLFEVSAFDPLTFALVTVLLLGVAFAATAVPAWRTTRVDPMVALRDE